MTDITRLLELCAPVITKLTGDVIIILDAKGEILYSNERTESWIGYTKEELVGKNIATSGLISMSSVKTVLQNLVLRFLGREISPYTVEFISKDKRTLTATIKAQLIKDEAGKTLADLVVITDISEKVIFEKALALEKEKTDIYIDIVGMIIVILDKEGKIKLLNKKGCEILKTTKEEAIDKDWFATFIPTEDRAKTKETFTKIILGNLEGVEEFENKIVTTEGNERLILWHNTYLRDTNGNIYATLGSGDDITERSEAERKLSERTAELEKTNQLMVGREIKMVELKNEIEKLKGGAKNL